MRRSICYIEPSSVRAGQISTWFFHYSPVVSLPKGTKLKFDLLLNNRSIDWEIPSTNLNDKKNVIYLELPSGKVIKAKHLKSTKNVSSQFEFILPSELESGENIVIVLGAPPQSESLDELGNGAQLFVQRRRHFHLYIDPKGKDNYEDPEIFSLDVKGNILKTIRIISPSLVTKKKRFDITVRFEDEFGNLTNFAPEGTLIELNHENLRENLNWKLFVPETGFVTLPNLYFNEPGEYTISLRNLTTNEIFSSSPIKCLEENDCSLMWGLLHGESEKADSAEHIESSLRFFRDDKALNFFSTSSFENQDETSQEIWKLISNNVADFNEDERFVSLLGFQYSGSPLKEGLRIIVYAKDNKPLLRQKDSKSSSLQKIYKNHSPKELISIPCFTSCKEQGFDFSSFEPDFERVVEIYNAWGSSEMTETEGNIFPIKGLYHEYDNGTVIKALKKNHRFGFVAGGYDDRGIYEKLFDSPQAQYHEGLTAIISKNYTRESLFEALYNRHCYATTGERIILGFFIANHPMGSELSSKNKPGLVVNRHISGYVSATKKLKKVEIIRNGSVLHTFHSEGNSLNYEYDDMENLDSICLSNKTPHPFVFYYLRVTQIDNHMAWGSPIWIDSNPITKKIKE